MLGSRLNCETELLQDLGLISKAGKHIFFGA